MAEQQGGYQLGRRHRPLDDWSLRLWGDIAPGAQKPTFFYIDFRYGLNEEYRDIELGVNFRKQGKEGKIKAFPSQSIFYAICDLIKKMSENPDRYPSGFARVFDNMTQMVAGRRVDTPVSDVKVVVGMDDEGIWIALAKKGHDNIKCRFSAPMSWVLRNAQGQPLTAKEVSIEMAYSVATQWRNYVEHVLKTQYMGDDKLDAAKAKKKADAFSGSRGGGQGGGQGGNGGWGGNNNGGGQQSQPAAATADTWTVPGGGNAGGGYDEDIPF